MVRVKEVTNYLEEIAPLQFQESYDNAGLIVGNPEQSVTGILTCLDATEAVLEEAVNKNCNLVVAHHPIIFKGLKRLTGQNYVERTVIQAIRHDIAIYAIHTNLDNVFYQGVNAMIAEKIGLVNKRILLPKTGHQEEEQVGAGMIGDLPKPMTEERFLEHLKQTMRVGCLKFTRLLGVTVRCVALCGGAGSFLLRPAIDRGADIFISADFKYHEFFDADDRIVIADIGHYESEQFTIELLVRILSKKFNTFAVRSTEVSTNPVQYY